MARFRLRRSHIVDRPLDEVFAFFSDPANLELLTPPWLRFRLLERSTDEVREGTEMGYALRVRGLPLRWRGRISRWRPPFQFVDVQVRGPYRSWVHTHRFRAVGASTEVRDEVEYALPGPAPIARLLDRLFVRRDLERVFDYRERVLPAALGRSAPRTPRRASTPRSPWPRAIAPTVCDSAGRFRTEGSSEG